MVSLAKLIELLLYLVPLQLMLRIFSTLFLDGYAVIVICIIRHLTFNVFISMIFYWYRIYWVYINSALSNNHYPFKNVILCKTMIWNPVINPISNQYEPAAIYEIRTAIYNCYLYLSFWFCLVIKDFPVWVFPDIFTILPFINMEPTQGIEYLQLKWKDAPLS